VDNATWGAAKSLEKRHIPGLLSVTARKFHTACSAAWSPLWRHSHFWRPPSFQDSCASMQFIDRGCSCVALHGTFPLVVVVPPILSLIADWNRVCFFSHRSCMCFVSIFLQSLRLLLIYDTSWSSNILPVILSVCFCRYEPFVGATVEQRPGVL